MVIIITKYAHPLVLQLFMLNPSENATLNSSISSNNNNNNNHGICKARSPRLNALNKHDTHNVHRDKNAVSNLTKANT